MHWLLSVLIFFGNCIYYNNLDVMKGFETLRIIGLVT